MDILLLFRASLAEKVNSPVLHQGGGYSFSAYNFIVKVYQAGY